MQSDEQYNVMYYVHIDSEQAFSVSELQAKLNV